MAIVTYPRLAVLSENKSYRLAGLRVCLVLGVKNDSLVPYTALLTVCLRGTDVTSNRVFTLFTLD
jgi:hypothetical protein